MPARRSAKPLTGKRVLLTRAAGENGELRERLKSVGAKVREMPLIAIELPLDLAPLDQALRTVSSFDWIAFTSGNAVTSVLDRLRELDLTLAGVKVAAVGQATAADLRSRGVKVDAIPKQPSGGALARKLLGESDCVKVLLPQSHIARPELANQLSRHGVQVEAVTAYRTVWSELTGAKVPSTDAIVLASPSSARHLYHLIGRERRWRGETLVCIGTTTAQALKDLGVAPAAVARTPSTDGLFEAIQSVLQQAPA
ncbi:MAG: uroporphyrinogen-III synthase [Chloroflexota bacterium]